jgi:hypothetical protein
MFSLPQPLSFLSSFLSFKLFQMMCWPGDRLVQAVIHTVDVEDMVETLPAD